MYLTRLLTRRLNLDHSIILHFTSENRIKTNPPPSLSVCSQYPFGSNIQTTVEQKKGKFPIWPEWSEADINAEKWDAGKSGKEKDKTGKSPIFVSKLLNSLGSNENGRSFQQQLKTCGNCV